MDHKLETESKKNVAELRTLRQEYARACEKCDELQSALLIAKENRREAWQRMMRWPCVSAL